MRMDWINRGIREIPYNPVKLVRLICSFAVQKSVDRRDAQVALIQYGNYAGVTPIYYDYRRRTFHVLKSKCGLRSYFVVGTVFVLCSIFMTLVLAYQTVGHRSYDIVLVFKVSAFIFCGIIHGHTYLKRYEIVQLINGYNYRTFQLHRGEPSQARRSRVLIPKFIHLTIVGMFGMSTISALLYVFSCDIHFLSPGLPVCTAGRKGVTAHASLFHTIFIYWPVHAFLSNLMGCVMYPYLAVALNVILDGVEIVNRLRSPDWKQKMGHVDVRWLLEYRSCQVMGRHVNNCLGQYLLPIHMSQIIFFCIVSIYVAIRVNLWNGFKFGLGCIVGLIFIFFALWKHGTVFRDRSQAGIQSQLLRCSARSRYSQRVLKSCQPLSIDIGNYFKLTERVIFRSYAAVVERSISLLLI